MTESIRTLETLELVGGIPCLDFVNTVNSRLEPVHDYFREYSDLYSWGHKLGILSSAQFNQLQKLAQTDPATAESTLLAAHTLRDLLYRLFSNAARGAEPHPKDRQSFVVFYGEAIAQSRLQKKDDHYVPTWDPAGSLDALLWPVIYSAGKLLLSGDLGHVRECPGCGWLFLDTSKNQSRRWCSMNTCGARDKMRRYHNRQRMK